MNGLSIIEQAKAVGVKEIYSDSNTVSSSWYRFESVAKFVQLFGTPGKKSLRCVCRLEGSTRIELD